MKNNLDDYIRHAENAITEICFPAHPEQLYNPMRYMLSLGGKRMRPVLTLMSCEAFSQPFENGLPAARAVELFHNFSLIHDDIMDAAPLRRGHETVHTKWNHNVGILSGDGMLIEAYKQLNSYSPEISHKLIAVFNQTATEVCEGQQMDMDFENRSDVSLGEYIEMIRLKTSVLLGCSLQFGAIIANRSSEDQKNIYEFGINLGISFQIKDDLLDLYGESSKVGKQTGGDILSSKKTFLVLTAFQDADSEQKKRLIEMLGDSNQNRKIETALKLFDQLNIKEKTSQAIQDYHDAALNKLQAVEMNNDVKNVFIQLTDFLLSRDY